jgi:hypothetical protein
MNTRERGAIIAISLGGLKCFCVSSRRLDITKIPVFGVVAELKQLGVAGCFIWSPLYRPSSFLLGVDELFDCIVGALDGL